MLRRDGNDAEAIKYFERAAALGFQIAIADVGFTYGQSGSSALNPALAYAWLSLAISRESAEVSKKYLEKSRNKLLKAMNKSELSEGNAKFEELEKKFATIPVWSDNKRSEENTSELQS